MHRSISARQVCPKMNQCPLTVPERKRRRKKKRKKEDRSASQCYCFCLGTVQEFWVCTTVTLQPLSCVRKAVYVFGLYQSKTNTGQQSPLHCIRSLNHHLCSTKKHFLLMVHLLVRRSQHMFKCLDIKGHHTNM